MTVNKLAVESVTVENDTLHLQGDVSFHTLPDIIKQLEAKLTPAILSLDCSAVAKVDSSTIALLLFALQLSNKKNMKLKIVQATDAIKKLMKLYGVEEFLLA